MKFDPKKPKVLLRRFTDPLERLFIKTFILNKNNEAGYRALKALQEAQKHKRTDYRSST